MSPRFRRPARVPSATPVAPAPPMDAGTDRPGASGPSASGRSASGDPADTALAQDAGTARRGTWRTLAIVAALAASGLMSSVPGAALAAVSAEGVIARAERAMGSVGLKAIRFRATGIAAASVTAGPPPEPGADPDRHAVGRFVRTLDYANAALREDALHGSLGSGGEVGASDSGACLPVATAFLHGRHAWNLVGDAPVAAPAALEARQHDLWASPHGVLAAARRNRATVAFRFEDGRPVAAVSFTVPGVMTATAIVTEDGLVERVEARVTQPSGGEATVVTHYADYLAHGPVRFPSRIRQSWLGRPAVDLEVTAVELDPPTGFGAPASILATAERARARRI